MNLREVADRIVLNLGDELKRAKFTSRRQTQGITFRRKLIGGWQEISFPIVDSSPEYWISCFMLVRIDEVQALFSEAMQYPLRNDTGSFFRKISQYIQLPPGGCVIVRELEEIDALMGGWKSVIFGTMMPILDNLQDLQSLDKTLNGQPMQGQPQGDSTGNLEIRLIAAHLARNKNFESIVELCKESARGSRAVANVNKCIDYLRTHV